MSRCLLLLSGFVAAVVPAISLAQAGSIQFSPSTYPVNESGGSVHLTITRTGGSIGQVQANWVTAPGTAVAGTDYGNDGGVLTWASGDATSRTVSVPIGDAHVTGGGTRSFSVELYKPVGGVTLGTPATATVTITDNDPAQGQFLSGTIIPSANFGVVGDMYLDTQTGQLYGPKTASGWGAGVSMIGPPGPPGPEGNANITEYQVQPVNADWVYNSQYSFETSPGSYTEYFTRYYGISDSNLTQDFISNGYLDVYIMPNPIANPNQWVKLPYSFLDGSGDFYYTIGFQEYVGEIELDYFFQQIVPNTSLPTLSSYVIPTYNFKVVYGTTNSIGSPIPPVDSRPVVHDPANGERFRVVRP